MVLFGVENQKHTFSKKLSNNTDAYLVIITNEITNEIIQSIDRLNKNIIFQIPYTNTFLDNAKRDITFDFKVDICVWNTFMRNIEYLEFRGKLVKNQLNVQHFECMTCVRGLYIGSTDYPLFDNENISNIPLIEYVSLNGYGLVIGSENMEKWLEKLKQNGYTYERCY
jgi:hypothetical protein